MLKKLRILSAIVTLMLASSACGAATGGGPTGAAEFFVVPEDSITAGLDPGTEGDAISDGWTVRYQKFLIAVGDIHASRSADPNDTIEDTTIHLVDMIHAPATGVSIAKFEGITADRWDKLGYVMPAAKSTDARDSDISDDDAKLMIDNSYTIYFEGTIAKTDGQSCDINAPTTCVDEATVAFKWGVSNPTSFDDCGSADGDKGFAVPSGGSVQLKPTIHGDHWFFSNIAQGSEEITTRKAQWIANVDANHDGETTIDELKAADAGKAFPASDGYVLSGGVIPVNNAFDYLIAQSSTLAHLNGDGDCPTRVQIR